MSSIPYARPSITELEVRYATDAAANGWGARCYEYIERFERGFCAHLGVAHAIATSSCTGALHMGLAALGIGSGDEVILGDVNWIASAAPIAHLGATPVLVDVLPDTLCVDPEQVRAALTSRTKAIIAVHLYGNPCALDTLLEIGRRHGVPVIEDAAEAIGTIYRGKRAGSLGTFGVFSFHGTKTMTTGEGGMLVTDDDGLHEAVLTLSNHGRARGERRQFWPDVIGFKYKLSNIQAAIGCAQLERVGELVAEKRRIFERYDDALRGSGVVLNPRPGPELVPGYWMINAIFPRDRMNVERRATLIDALAAIGADARVCFWPLTRTGLFEVRHRTLVASDVSARSLNLPSAFGLADDALERVAEVVRRFAEAPVGSR